MSNTIELNGQKYPFRFGIRCIGQFEQKFGSISDLQNGMDSVSKAIDISALVFYLAHNDCVRYEKLDNELLSEDDALDIIDKAGMESIPVIMGIFKDQMEIMTSGVNNVNKKK